MFGALVGMEMIENKDLMKGSTPFLNTCQLNRSNGDAIKDEANRDVMTTFETASHDTTKASTCLARQSENTFNTKTGIFLYKPAQFLRRQRGLVLAVLSPLFFSIEHTFIAVLNETLDAFQVVFLHVPILMICSLVLVVYKGIRPPRDYKHLLLLLVTGSLQAMAALFISLSLKTLAVGDTVTISRTCVIQVSFLSCLILKEPLRLFDILFALLAFGGVIFIARPPFIFKNIWESSTHDFTFQGVFFAVAASFAIASFLVLSRKLSNMGVNSLFCIFFNITATVILSGLFAFIFGSWGCPTKREWLFSLLSGISYALAIATVFYALKVETATLVTILSTLQIFFAFVWQVVWLHLPPFWTSYIGAVLIFVACVGISVKNKPPLTRNPSTDVVAEQSSV